jgi:hypothetical protein
LYFSSDIGVRWAGQARTVMSVLLTLGVFMAHVIALGNVTVSLDGAVYYVTKVMAILLLFYYQSYKVE